MTKVQLDNFPIGLVVTTAEDHNVLHGNKDFYGLCQQKAESLSCLRSILTPASKIIVESFVMPLLLHEGHCKEIQLTINTPSGDKIPVLVNAVMHSAEKDWIYWAISSAQKRDDLYQELINLRNDLEDKAERLKQLSETDELTKLLNRRAFVADARTMIKQAKRNNLPYSFMMLDIDHFKHINDQLGHFVGDKVIADVGALLKKYCRENDLTARIGGEEFAIFSTSSATDSASQFAEKLLKVFSSEDIQGLNVTVSIGVATSFSDDFDTLYKTADRLLYQAKKNGRNQFCGHFCT